MKFAQTPALKRLVLGLLLLIGLWLPAAEVRAQTTGDITIQGNSFYKDHKPWLPKGVVIEGFNRPRFIPSAPQWMNKNPSPGRDWWGQQELDAARTIFGAEVLRFQISQPAFDPQSSIYDPKYVAEIVTVLKQARSAGFIVIASMDAQGENGLLNLPCMPNDSTVRAWQTLAPTFIHDHGVMFELFNEPCRANWGDARTIWAHGMQASIDAVRELGSTNILLLDGLGFGQSINDLFLLVHDPLPDHLALAVHPYLDPIKGQIDKGTFKTPENYFHDHFGKDASRYPVIATEWNATPTNGCAGTRTPELALALTRYLEKLHVGLIGWAIDSNYGKLVKDHSNFEPTDYTGFEGCAAKGSPPDETGSGGGKLTANFPND